MYVIHDLRFPIEAPLSEVLGRAAVKARLPLEDAFLLRRAVDARRAVPFFVYSVGFRSAFAGDRPPAVWLEPYAPPCPSGKEALAGRPVVVGFGPAGMFAALLLVRAGYRPLVLERGDCVEERTRAVARFFETGELDPDTNVQFGAGGAGTYSDGKLNTRINDPRCRFLLEEFVRFGAPESILWQAKPHIGTDLLRGVVAKIAQEIVALGGEIAYRAPLTDWETHDGVLCGVRVGGVEKIRTNCLILATGHSARDVYALAARHALPLEKKAFSVGVRVEHRQAEVDRTLYRDYAGHPALGAGEYAYSLRVGGRGVYTFCMCPGGKVIAAASEAGGVVTNGMSESARDGENANAALAVSVLPADTDSGLFSGVAFQRELEAAAFAAAGDFRAPAQTVGDFLAGRKTGAFGRVKPTYSRGVVGAELHTILPGFVSEYLELGLRAFARQAAFFGEESAVLTGVETRTSAPLRILRNESFCSPAADGIYPCGEGAGYAGGILSAAADGLRAAEHVLERYRVAE